MPLARRSKERLRSLKLEYNMTEHCNYGCNECSHFSPYMRRGESSVESFERDLSALARVLTVYRFRFVGGEPLLNKQLVEHVRLVRESGIADEIQACTNGALLDRTPDEAIAALDTLTISWYPDPRVDQSLIDRTIERCRRLNTKVGVLKIDKFRRMQVVRPFESSRLVQEIFDTCEIAHLWYCQTFYEGRFYLCSRPIFTSRFLGKLDENVEDFRETDGIALHEPNLVDRLEAILHRKEPLGSCRYCLGTVGKEVPWRQLSPSERKHPVRYNDKNDELIDQHKMRRLRIKRHFPLRSMLLMAPESLSGLAARFSRSLSRD